MERFNQRWYSKSLRSLDKSVYDESVSGDEIISFEEQIEEHFRSFQSPPPKNKNNDVLTDNPRLEYVLKNIRSLIKNLNILMVC